LATVKRGLLEKIFPGKKIPLGQTQIYRTLSQYEPIFSSFGNNAYYMDTVRKAVDTIARHGAKLHPRHVRRSAKGIILPESNLDYLLAIRPNPFMSGFEFRYKMLTGLLMDNNAFAYPQLDPVTGELLAIYPVPAILAEIFEGKDNEMLVRFSFSSGARIVLPYDEVIHLRRHFYKNDIWGDRNSPALLPVLELANTINQGIANTIKVMFNLRGILKYNAIGDDEEIKKNRDQFIATYADMSKAGGLASMDKKMDFQEVTQQPVSPTTDLVKFIESKVYSYFGINAKIVDGSYTADEGMAFFKGVLEPLSLQLSQEFTYKLFSPRERGFGNEIVFECSRIQFMGEKDKTELLKQAGPLGLFRINEMREWFGYGPVPGGEKRVQTLNVVNADKADKYQGVGNDDKDPDEEDDVADPKAKDKGKKEGDENGDGDSTDPAEGNDA